MSHNYLLALYGFLESQKQAIKGTAQTSSSSADQKCFDAGRLSILTELEEFLHAQLDPKLPRRIYRRLASGDGKCLLKMG